MSRPEDYGRYADLYSAWKHNPKDPFNAFRNSITRRNREMSQTLPARKPCSSLASANLSSLRLYRHICRMIPYIIKIHEITHRVTPQQAKLYVGNHFRANATITDLGQLDYLLDIGYQILYESEWHHIQTGYLYKYLMSPKGILNDQGIDRFDDYRAQKKNRKEGPSSFLKTFYKGHKSFEI